jgi:hypothetical protein
VCWLVEQVAETVLQPPRHSSARHPEMPSIDVDFFKFPRTTFARAT